MNQKDIDKEQALDDYIVGFCPDVEERIPAPKIRCACGYSGLARTILSHLKEALCPKCGKWVKYEENE